MIKSMGMFLLGGILILGACGEESAQPIESEQADEMDMNDGEMEMPEEETEAPIAENADVPEAGSGEASPLLDKGDETSFIFNDAGEFNIYCQPHPDMTMTVTVEEGAEISGDTSLDIADFAFGEETLTVAPGTTITWTNQDDVQHNVSFE